MQLKTWLMWENRTDPKSVAAIQEGQRLYMAQLRADAGLTFHEFSQALCLSMNAVFMSEKGKRKWRSCEYIAAKDMIKSFLHDRAQSHCRALDNLKNGRANNGVTGVTTAGRNVP
jgi:hypothetical protein